MVQKSWARVRDLFYRIYYRSWESPLTSVSVARSLRYHPEKAKFIPGFSPFDFSDSDGEDWENISDDTQYLPIFRALLANLEMMDCVYNSRRIAHSDFLHRLCHIQGIEGCEIRGNSTFTRAEEKRSLTVSDIQTVIGHWKHLSSLTVDWAASRG